MIESRPVLSFFPVHQVASIVNVGKPDRYGKGSLSEPKEYPCFIQMNSDNEPYLDYMGDQRVYTATMLFPEPVELKVKDKIIYEDDLGKKQEADVIAVQYKRDFSRNLVAVKAVVV